MSAEVSQVIDPLELPVIDDYQFLGDSETVGKKRRVVEGYRLKASIFHAAQYARCARASIYRWLESDPTFAEAMAGAHEDAADIMESSTYEEALGSKDKPGNALLKMFWLKAHRPKFRDKVSVDVSEVQERIGTMLSRLEEAQRQQLPAAMTDFIDTSYSEQSREYATEPLSNTMQISHLPQDQQKED